MKSRKVVRTGIYKSTSEQWDPSSLDSTNRFVDAVNSFNPAGAFADLRSSLLKLLSDFGAIPTTERPAPGEHPDMDWCPYIGFLPKSPLPRHGNKKLDQIVFDRAKTAMLEVNRTMRAIENGFTEAAAMAGVRLGRQIEMLNVTLHEPNAKLGNERRKLSRRGAAAANKKVKAKASETRRKIVERFEQENKAGRWTNGKLRMYSKIAAACNCSPRTVSGTVYSYLKRQEKILPQTA